MAAEQPGCDCTDERYVHGGDGEDRRCCSSEKSNKKHRTSGGSEYTAMVGMAYLLRYGSCIFLAGFLPLWHCDCF